MSHERPSSAGVRAFARPQSGAGASRKTQLVGRESRQKSQYYEQGEFGANYDPSNPRAGAVNTNDIFDEDGRQEYQGTYQPSADPVPRSGAHEDPREPVRASRVAAPVVAPMPTRESAMSMAKAFEKGGESDQTEMVMDSLLEKLKLLNYEEHFCKKYNFELMPRGYFAFPSSNPHRQFFYFSTLLAWLANCIHNAHSVKVEFLPPTEFADPNQVVADMVHVLVDALHIPIDFSHQKLKQGHGFHLCKVLDTLCDRCMDGRFRFDQPVYPPPQDDAAPLDDALDGILEDDDDVAAAQDVDIPLLMDDAMDSAFDKTANNNKSKSKLPNNNSSNNNNSSTSTNSLLLPVTAAPKNFDAEAWRLECDRCAPLLKIHAMGVGDWRTHLVATRQHHATVTTILPGTKTQLEALAGQVSKTVDQIKTKEAHLNRQFKSLSTEYQQEKSKLDRVTQLSNKSKEKVNALQLEFERVSSELDRVKGSMEDWGKGMSDTAPVAIIKKALSKLKRDIQMMEVRIGIVQQQLSEARVAAAHVKGPVGSADDSIDME